MWQSVEECVIGGVEKNAHCNWSVVFSSRTLFLQNCSYIKTFKKNSITRVFLSLNLFGAAQGVRTESQKAKGKFTFHRHIQVVFR